jgi:hypothetical protein
VSKLYQPVVSGALGGPIRFQARLSGTLPWTVSVTTPTGSLVARQSGQSALVDWSWQSAGAGPGPLRWTIAAGQALPATGTLGAPSPPAPVTPPAAAGLLAGLAATPSVVTPAADGGAVLTVIEMTLAQAAQVTVQVGAQRLASATLAAGSQRLDCDLGSLPDGRYRLLVTARAGEQTVTQTVDLVVDRTLAALTVQPAAFSPNADGVSDTIAFGFSLAQGVPVQVAVQRAGATVATIFSGQLGPGSQTVGWDGAVAGSRLPDGQYTVVVTATDSLATVSLVAPFTIDTAAPTLVVVNGPALQFQLSEPATVTLTVAGQLYTASEPAGVFTFAYAGPVATSWSAQARDGAGNVGAAVSGP